mmetsp:Transcript_88227/g.175263  ORF Transcript_88227/g.175263 Transcript_88227/m.175263 type:complete len:549 (-) Transcript_88227:265-1911(-)
MELLAQTACFCSRTAPSPGTAAGTNQADVSVPSVAVDVGPHPTLIGFPRSSNNSTDGTQLYPGLFEHGEDPLSYGLERQWYHQRIIGGPEEQWVPLRQQRRLNEFGHSEDRDEYRQRRQFYQMVVTHEENLQESAHERRAQIPLPPRAWRTLCRVMSIMILTLSVWFSANTFLTEICEDYGVGKQHATLLTVLVNLGFASSATASAVAQLPDRMPPSRLLLIGCWGCAFSNAILASGLPFAVLALARFLNGMALAFVYPILMRFTAGWFPPGKRGTALGMVVGSLTVGIALPNLLKAMFPATPWRFVVLGTSALAIAGGALAWNVSDGPFAERTLAFSTKNVKGILNNKNWHLVTWSYCAHNIELFGGWAWMGAFLQSYVDDQAGGNAGTSGESLASAAAFGVVAVGSIGAGLGGKLADRIGKRRLIMAMHLFSGLIIAILPSASSILPPVALFSVAAVWGLTVIADSAQYSALLTEVMPNKALLGTAITFSLAVGFISTAAGIFVVPLIFEWAGWNGAFPCLALGPLVGILLIFAVSVEDKPPSARL